MEIYRVKQGSPDWLYKAYDYVRTDAFCFGQNIPIETEFSHDEPLEELLAIVLVEDHKPVGGCRITYPRAGVGKIERVCHSGKAEVGLWKHFNQRGGKMADRKRYQAHCNQQSGQSCGLLQ